MSQTIDTNILMYAFNHESPHHQIAKEILEELAMSPRAWALTWVTVYEFLRAASHPKLSSCPTSVDVCWQHLQDVLHSPSLRMLHETERHQAILNQLVQNTKLSPRLVHDAHIVTLMLEHGVNEIITADTDFHRFPGITVTNPFVSA